MSNDTVFVKGLYFDLPRQGAPAFVKGKLSIKVVEFAAFMQENMNNGGYVNIDLKIAKSGKAYAELNTWKPSDKPEGAKTEEIESSSDEPINDEDIPF